MTTTLQQLLAAHPEAVDDINSTWPTKLDPKSVDTTSAIIREHAVKLGVASYAEACLDSVASLLSAIEAKLKAERGLSDAEIEGMRYSVIRSIHTERAWVGRGDQQGGNAANSINAAQIQNDHNACIDTLAAEIRRLRARIGEVK